MTALIEFVWAATAAGVAIGMYPVLRKHNAALALGSVTGRIVEGVFVLIGTLSLLVLLSVSQKSLAPGAASFQATADAMLAARVWAHGFVMFLAFLSGAAMYYYVLYRSRLVPRWLAGLGLFGAALGLVATVYSGFAQDFGFTTVNTVLNIPIALQEMVLAVWLIVKGFSAPTAAAIRPTEHRLDLSLAVPTQAASTAH